MKQNKLTTLSLVISLVLAGNAAYATCTYPSILTTSNVTVTCTGLNTGTYSVKANNVTFINEGEFNHNGVVNFDSGQYGFIGDTLDSGNRRDNTFINKGKIIASQISYNQGHLGAVLSAGFRIGTFGNEKIINEKGASIVFERTKGSKGTIGALASLSNITGGYAIAENHGEIIGTDNHLNHGVVGMTVYSWKNPNSKLTAINTGSITLNTNQGTTSNGLLDGIYVNIYQPTNQLIEVTNSGNITLNNSGGAANSVGIDLYPSKGSMAHVLNTGNITLTGKMRNQKTDEVSTAAGIDVSPTNVDNDTLTVIDNQGVVDAGGAASIHGAKSIEHVTNSGTLKGEVLLFNGSDTYTQDGSAAINEGVIDGGDDVSRSDGFIDVLTFKNRTTAVDDYTNFEEVKLENSQLTLGESYNSPNSLTFDIDSTSSIKTTGTSTINADVTNAGIIDLTGNATVGDSLTIKKRDASAGDDGAKGDLNNTGTIKFDVDFADLTADTVTVEGEVKGSGLVEINNVNKSTAEQPGAVIDLLIAANDSNTGDEDFNFVTGQRYNNNPKQGLLGNDPYLWELKTKDNGSGHNWVLGYLADTTPQPGPTPPKPTPVIRPEIPVMTSLPNIGKELSGAEQERLHTRLGELRNNLCNDICLDEGKTAGWLRAYGGKTSFDGQSSFELNGDYKGINLGFDQRVYTNNDWTLYAGVFAGKHNSDWDTSGKGSVVNAIDAAHGSVNGWSVGGYATAFTRSGTYVDGVVKYSKNKADISAPSHHSNTRGKTLSASLEVGHSIKLDNNWVVEPQAQVTVTKVDWDNISANGSNITIDEHTFVTGRLGARAEKTIKTESGEIKPWAYVGVNHEFSDTANITYGKTKFDSQKYGTAAELRVGITADLKPGIAIYGGIGYTSDFDDYKDINGHVGIRATW